MRDKICVNLNRTLLHKRLRNLSDVGSYPHSMWDRAVVFEMSKEALVLAVDSIVTIPESPFRQEYLCHAYPQFARR